MKLPPRSPLSYLLYLTRVFPGWAIAAFFAVLTASTIDGINNFLLKNLINALTQIPTDGMAPMNPWFWSYLYIGGFILSWASWRTSGFMGMRWITGIRARSYETLFSYLTYHSTDYFNNRFAGALTNKISNASESGSRIIQTTLWQFLPLGMSFIVGLAVAATANILLAVILGAWILVFLSVMTYLALKRRPLAMAASESNSRMKGVMVDSATNMSAVHLSGHHEYEMGHLQTYITTARLSARRIWFYSEISLVIGNVMMAVFISSMLLTSVALLQAGIITVGDIAMILGLTTSLLRQLLFIGNEINKVMDDYAQTAEGLEELIIPHGITDEKNAKELKIKTGMITFDDVSFGYGESVVFDHFNLAVPGGQKVGLVGHSGAGKTSLTSILLRQYDVKDGAILIDGQNIRKTTQKSIRQQIAIVPQDTSLFHRTIRENIRYGNLKATDEDVYRAAKNAQAHEFILKLQKGYDTLVGERGVKLSGGQRQRVAIARAMLKNAPILVLDEATSALDSESETAIQHALQELMKGKTVLAIAHRLSTLRMMDRIIVLDKGQVTEDGTHEELIAKKGIYARLWESQVKGFIQE